MLGIRQDIAARLSTAFRLTFILFFLESLVYTILSTSLEYGYVFFTGDFESSLLSDTNMSDWGFFSLIGIISFVMAIVRFDLYNYLFVFLLFAAFLEDERKLVKMTALSAVAYLASFSIFYMSEYFFDKRDFVNKLYTPQIPLALNILYLSISAMLISPAILVYGSRHISKKILYPTIIVLAFSPLLVLLAIYRPNTSRSDVVYDTDLFESEIYGNLIISEEAQRIANNSYDFETRHELYEDYDENLRTDEDAIDTRFFAAKAIVLSRSGLGIVDTLLLSLSRFVASADSFILTEESSGFLRESSKILSYANVEIYLRLIQGEELPFAMGLTGEALDNAIVEFEQQTMENIIGSDLIFGWTLPTSIRSEVLQDINDSLNSDNGIALLFSDDCVEEALNQTFPNNDIDFADKADRIALGKKMVSNQRNPEQSSCM